ncbi:MAG: O-antigen ligase family protein [Eubacteriales bacterium]
MDKKIKKQGILNIIRIKLGDMCSKPTIILAIIGFIIPIYVRGIVMYQSNIERQVYRIFTSPTNIDVFGLSKARLLIALTILLGIHLLWLLLKDKIKLRLSWNFLFILLFVLSIGVSICTSEFKDISLIGFSDRYEGVLVYLNYIILIIITYILAKKIKDVELILKGILLSVVPILIYSIFRLNGVDLILSKATQGFMFDLNSNEYYGQIEQFLSKYRANRSAGFKFISGTLFNPNYLGVYSVVVFYIGTGFYCFKEKLKVKGLYLLLTLISFFLLILSGSKSGLYILICMFILYFFLEMFRTKGRALITLMTLVMTCIFIFITMNVITQGKIYNKFFEVSKENFSVQTDNEELNNKVVSIDIKETETIITDKVSQITIINDNGVPKVKSEDIFNKYKQWEVDFNENILIIRHYGNRAYFGVLQDGRIGVYGPVGLIDYVPKPKELLINGHLFTSRGIIWSNTIELIGKRPWTGYGADTYTIYQPYDEVVNRMNYSGSTTKLSINPHNMYLLLAYNFGVPGLLFFIIFVGSILIKGIIIYIKNKEKRHYIQLVMIPLIVFLAMGLINDTIVGIGVILYILIGIANVSIYKILK